MTSSGPRNAFLLLLTAALVALAVVATWSDDAVPPGQTIYDEGVSTNEPPPRVTVEQQAAPTDRDAAAPLVEVTLERLARVLPQRAEPIDGLLVVSDATPRAEAQVGTWVAGLAALGLGKQFRGWQITRFAGLDDVATYRACRLTPAHRGLDGARMLLGPLTHQAGLVRDDRGAPLEDAAVWLGGRKTKTDSDGRFRFEPARAQDGLPLVVRKRGFVPHYEVLTARGYHALDRKSGAITLHRGVSLSVAFTSGVGPDARFFLLPSGGRDSRWLRYPLFFDAIEPTWTLRDGGVWFEGLPRGARVKVRMLRPGFAPATSAEIRLDEDVNAARVDAMRLERVRGVVVAGADGKPLAGAWVTARPMGQALRLQHTDWMLPPAAYVVDADAVQTDAEGRFELSRPVDKKGRSLVAIEARGCVGLGFELGANHGGHLHVPMFPTRGYTAPRLEFKAGAGLPACVRLVVRDAEGKHGPYVWQTAEPFGLRLSRRALLRVTTAVGDAEPEAIIRVVTGATGISVGR